MKINYYYKSKYFTLREMLASNTAQKKGIDNTQITEQQLFNLCHLMSNLDLVRELWGKPIRVNSGYRCPQLNAAVGGKSTSYHQQGQAADITTGTKKGNLELFEMLKKDKHIYYDLIIDEQGGSWIHYQVKWKENRHLARRIP